MELTPNLNLSKNSSMNYFDFPLENFEKLRKNLAQLERNDLGIRFLPPSKVLEKLFYQNSSVSKSEKKFIESNQKSNF